MPPQPHLPGFADGFFVRPMERKSVWKDWIAKIGLIAAHRPARRGPI
jgi:hypothetical protein